MAAALFSSHGLLCEFCDKRVHGVALQLDAIQAAVLALALQCFVVLGIFRLYDGHHVLDGDVVVYAEIAQLVTHLITFQT
jgi:hypothetical protein